MFEGHDQRPEFGIIKKIAVNVYTAGFAFSALTLLVGWQEGHPACKKLSS